jgi:osmotically-inducible protein OsmY
MNTAVEPATRRIGMIVLGCMLLFGQNVYAFEGELKDAWLTGKVETVLTLNEHLRQYPIAARVNDSVVTLTGTVGTEIDKSLASVLVNGIANIREVHNNLEIDASLRSNPDRTTESVASSFARWINDLTISAMVKSKLLGNVNTEGLAISVDTQDSAVTLDGEVDSVEERVLAEEIAKNTRFVASVVNNLTVRQQISDAN